MERRAAQDGEMLPNIGFSNMMRNYIQEEMNKKRDLQMQVGEFDTNTPPPPPPFSSLIPLSCFTAATLFNLPFPYPPPPPLPLYPTPICSVLPHRRIAMLAWLPLISQMPVNTPYVTPSYPLSQPKKKSSN